MPLSPRCQRSLFCLLGGSIALTLVGCGSGGTKSADLAAPVPSHTAVLTYHNDNARTGANTTETILTPSNVNVSQFGKIASFPVTGYVYAQPLYVPGVAMPDGTSKNLLIVATQHDQVYAFDVGAKQIAWQKDFLSADGTVSTLSSETDLKCDDVVPEMGIASTPVIDSSTNTVYLLVRTKETGTGQAVFFQRLHALDLATGQDKVTAQVITTPPNMSSQFDPLLNSQRPGLLLVNNQVYIAWSSQCDIGPYSGWVMSFDKATLQPTGGWSSTAQGHQGGIWMGGAGLAADASGDVYGAVGNGTNTAAMNGGNEYGMSAVRLHWPQAQSPTVVDFFTPFNFADLSDQDMDLASGGTVLLPPHDLAFVSKAGSLYLLDTQKMGHWQAGSDSQIVKRVDWILGYTTPGYWNGHLYIGSADDTLKAFSYDPNSAALNVTPTSVASVKLGYPGSTPSITSNGSQQGIVWILRMSDTAVLEAYDASDLTKKLYTSEDSSSRDSAGPPVKYAVPTVADGMVFVGAQNQVSVYGLLH